MININYIMNSEPNDCTICAVTNALKHIGISITRQEAKEVTRYNEHGGHAHIGLKIIADKLGLQSECYPKHNDIIWTQYPTKQGVEIAQPELNKDKLFIGFKNRLHNGWVAVTTHRWEDTEDFHAVAIIGLENEKIKVICSLKGEYLADQEMFVSKKNQLNGLMGTYWVKSLK